MHMQRRRPAHGGSHAVDYVKAPPYIPGEYYDNDDEFYQAHSKKGAAFRMKHSSEESIERPVGDKKDEMMSRRAERARTRNQATAQ